MKTKQQGHKHQKMNKYALIGLTLLILAQITLQNRRCVVDQCKTCRYVNIDSCEACEDGFYLRTFAGDEKGRPYNACWSLWKTILGILGSLLLCCSYCYCCWKAWKKGKNVTRIVNKKLDKQIIKDSTKTGDPNTTITGPNGQAPAGGANIQVPGGGAPGGVNINPGVGGVAPNMNVGGGAPARGGYNPGYAQPNGQVSTPMPSSSRPLYSPRPVTPTTSSRPYKRKPSRGKDITIIRERPKTIIRERSPKRAQPQYQQQQPQYQPQQMMLVPVQPPPTQVYATPQRASNAYYSNPPRRLF